MIDIILQYKWHILLIFEILSYFFLGFSAYARYWLNSSFLCILSLILSGVFGYFPDFVIPILMCIQEGSIRGLFNSWESLLYAFIIIVIFIIQLKLGKKYFKRLDTFLMRKAQEKKDKISQKKHF